MKFQLPQFINTEIKLVGPLTLKQFAWVASGTITIFFLVVVLKNIWAIFLAIPVGIFSLALAFVKIDEVPLINYIAYMLSYTLNPKKYVYSNKDQSLITLPEPHHGEPLN